MTHYYVATAESGGDNGNPGSLEEPWLTFAHADTQIDAGDTVHVRGGIYVEKFTIATDGASGNRVTFQAYQNENPVIDGENTLPTGSYPDVKWIPLVNITGDHVDFDGFEVKNSRGRGVEVYGGTYAILRNLITHHIWDVGILAEGTYSTVEDCEVYQCLYSNSNHDDPNWGFALTAVNVDHHTFRRNVVYNNYGEGLCGLRAGYITMEDNVVYDNLKVQMYLDNVYNSIIQRNLVYATDDTDWWRYEDAPAPGITPGDEDYGQGDPMGHHHTIINNIVIGCGSNIRYWQELAGGGLKNDTIANNTLVQAVGRPAISIGAADAHSSTIIKDNVIYQTIESLADVATDAGLVFDYNCWFNDDGNTPEADAQGANDVNDDPDLADPTHALSAGAVDASWYRLTAPSPCRGAGLAVTEVTEDYWQNIRRDPPVIGAHEYRRRGLVAMIV